MATVVFYNLLRSKYNMPEIDVSGATIQDVIDGIVARIPEATPEDFRHCVVLHDNLVVHPSHFDKSIGPHDRIAITHFVGGG